MSRARASHSAAALALLLNAFVWGVSWWPFRALQGAGLHPLWATCLIYAVATLVIVLWRPRSAAQLLRAPSLWLLVLASGATNAAFNWGVTIGDVVRVVLLFYLMPLWAVLLARLLLGESVRALALVRVALALLGAAVVLRPAGGGWPVPHTLAEWLGVAGGFAFALNNVLLRREADQPDAARALAMFVGGALVAGLLALALGVDGVVPALPAAAPLWMAGTFGMGLAFLGANLALQYGAARLPANVTAVVMITEVVFASTSSVLLGASALTAALAVGGTLIVGAALLAARG